VGKGQRITGAQAALCLTEWSILKMSLTKLGCTPFDSVVSTFTLCSIANVEQALKEIYRVLKPGGQFFFVEHGLSNEPEIQIWQNRLTPIQKVIADGCHLNRKIRQLIEKQFDMLTIEELYAENLPKITAYFYQGIATKVN